MGVFSAIVTPITAAEVLVKPLKKGQMSIADKYRNAIRNMPNISNIKFDVEIGFMAGSLRAKYGLPLPDMLQVAAALAQPANAIITNDRDIQRVRETNVFLLSDLATWYRLWINVIASEKKYKEARSRNGNWMLTLYENFLVRF